MKFTLIVLTFVFSLTASAADYFVKMNNQECIISNNKVTSTITVMKGEVGLVTTKEIKTFGWNKLTEKAIDSATGRESVPGIEHAIIKDGVRHSIHVNDSYESGVLIRLIVKACF